MRVVSSGDCSHQSKSTPGADTPKSEFPDVIRGVLFGKLPVQCAYVPWICNFREAWKVHFIMGVSARQFRQQQC